MHNFKFILTIFQLLKVILINLFAILIMLAKMATLDLITSIF